MGPDYLAGREFLGGFMDGFKEKGGQIIQEQWFPVGNVDFAAYIAALKPADACAAWVEGPGAVRLIPQYDEYGFSKKMPMIAAFASNIIDEDILDQMGDKALGISGPSAYASTLDNATNKKAVARFKAKHGVRPGDTFAIAGYMNGTVIMEGLKAAKGKTDPETLRKAILGLKLKDTITGPLRFITEGSGGGMGVFNIYIVEVAKFEGGEYAWKVAYTYPNMGPR